MWIESEFRVKTDSINFGRMYHLNTSCFTLCGFSIYNKAKLISDRVFPRRLTQGRGIFNNRLLFENNRLLFFLLFSGNFGGGTRRQGLDGGDKVVMAGS